MEIDSLEVLKSKTLLHANFLVIFFFISFVNGAKLPKDLPFLEI